MKMEVAASYSFLLLRHRPEGIDCLEKKNKQNLSNSDFRSPSKPPAPDPPEEGGWPLSPRDLLKLVNPSLTSSETSNLHQVHQPLLPPRSSRGGCLPPSSLSSSSPSSSSSSSSSSSPPCDLSLSHSSPQQGANTADNAAATVLTTVLTKKSELAGKIRKRIDDSEKRKIEITEESVANDEVGAKLEDALAAFAQDVQLERYRGHVDEVEKVISRIFES